MSIHTTADLMAAAARALVRRDGDFFDDLIAINEGWIQPRDVADAYNAALRAMQESAYLLHGEPTELPEIFDLIV